MTVEQEYPAQVVTGIAKKIGTELEALPLETHQAVVSILAQLFQHRGMRAQNRLEREKLEREEQREQREREQAEQLRNHVQRIAVQPPAGIEAPQAVRAGR